MNKCIRKVIGAVLAVVMCILLLPQQTVKAEEEVALSGYTEAQLLAVCLGEWEGYNEEHAIITEDHFNLSWMKYENGWKDVVFQGNWKYEGAVILEDALKVSVPEIPVDDYMYNAEYYANANEDVAVALNNDPVALYQHWINYGMAEGRNASMVFNAKYYLEVNPDVAAVVGNDYVAAYWHFVNEGLAAGLESSPVFSVKYYLEANADVAEVFNGVHVLAAKHFNENAIAEGRSGSGNFDYTVYRACNTDVEDLYGDYIEGYYIHYINHGRAEGRTGGLAAGGNGGTTGGNTGGTTGGSAELDKEAVSYRIFDAEFYLGEYPYLKNSVGTEKDELYRYWLEEGIAEGQCASPVFDPEEYAELNSDVAQAFGTNYAAIAEHFFTSGIAEGRSGSREFDYTVYADCNKDVAAVYGDNKAGYYFHYVSDGRAEGRTARLNAEYIRPLPDITLPEGENSWTEYYATGQVKRSIYYDTENNSIIVYELYRNAFVAKSASITNGVLDYVIEYNKNGNPIKDVEFYDSGAIQSVCEFNNGSRVKLVHYYENGKVQWLSEYGKEEVILRTRSYDSNGVITQDTQFNEDGRIKKQIVYRDGKVQYYTENEYNEDGQQIGSVRRNGNDVVLLNETILYYDSGEMKTQNVYSYDDDGYALYFHRYEYDLDGSWELAEAVDIQYELLLKALPSGNTEGLTKYYKELAEAGSKIYRAIITEEMTDFEKLVAIHDYIVLHTDYDYENYLADTVPDSSYYMEGVLLYGVAVCDGYTKAMNLFLHAAGIESERVVGLGNGGSHAWNLVKIDGEWYHVDATWDDPIINGAPDSYYLRYKYFCIADSTMDDDHEWVTEDYPATDETDYEGSLLHTAYKYDEDFNEIYYFWVEPDGDILSKGFVTE